MRARAPTGMAPSGRSGVGDGVIGTEPCRACARRRSVRSRPAYPARPPWRCGAGPRAPATQPRGTKPALARTSHRMPAPSRVFTRPYRGLFVVKWLYQRIEPTWPVQESDGNRASASSDEILIRDRFVAVRTRASWADLAAEDVALRAAANAEIALLAPRAFVDGGRRAGAFSRRARLTDAPVRLFAGVRAIAAAP